MLQVPSNIAHFTADEISECLDGITEATSKELWAIVAKCEADKSYKPSGGDGSPDKNGVATFQWPEYTEHYANQPNQFWGMLTHNAQMNIVQAAAARAAEWDL